MKEKLKEKLDQVWKEIDEYLADQSNSLEDRYWLYTQTTGDVVFPDEDEAKEQAIEEWVNG